MNELIPLAMNFFLEPDVLKFLGISTPVVTSAIITIKKVSKLIETQKIEAEKKEAAFIEAIAQAMGEALKVEVDESLSAFRSVKHDQYLISKKELHKYAEKIVGTAPVAVMTLCPDLSEKDREVVIALWTNAVRDTFLTDVYEYHIQEVNRNGFLKKSLDEYVRWARTDLARASFEAFLTGMRQKYVNERIRCRIEWISENMDMDMIANTCEQIARDWRIELEKYYEKRDGKIKSLVDNIRNHIIAAKTRTKG